MAPTAPKKPHIDLAMKIRLAIDVFMFFVSIVFYLGTHRWEWLFIAPLASAMFLIKYRQISR